MNWRGRPLTSEVIVNSIAATSTRTGLLVEAELDTGTYPVGVSVSKARMQALPIEPHQLHGTWNYTIHPRQEPAADRTAQAQVNDSTHARSHALEALSDPRLTGMSRPELDALTADLAPAQAAQAEQRCYEQRGGRRRRAKGAACCLTPSRS
jgi:hypothetical protein